MTVTLLAMRMSLSSPLSYHMMSCAAPASPSLVMLQLIPHYPKQLNGCVDDACEMHLVMCRKPRASLRDPAPQQSGAFAEVIASLAADSPSKQQQRPVARPRQHQLAAPQASSFARPAACRINKWSCHTRWTSCFAQGDRTFRFEKEILFHDFHGVPVMCEQQKCRAFQNPLQCTSGISWKVQSCRIQPGPSS